MSSYHITLLQKIAESPERCAYKVTQAEAFVIAKEILGLPVYKSWNKDRLCNAIVSNLAYHKKPSPSNLVQERVDSPKRISHVHEDLKEEEKRPYRASMSDSIRKQVLGDMLYKTCVARGGKISREEVIHRFQQLQKEGLFKDCNEDDFVKICDLKENPTEGCYDEIEARMDELEKANECGVCMEVEDSEQLYKQRLPCGHFYHASCLYQTGRHKITKEETLPYNIVRCPSCRFDMAVRKHRGVWEIVEHKEEKREEKREEIVVRPPPAAYRPPPRYTIQFSVRYASMDSETVIAVNRERNGEVLRNLFAIDNFDIVQEQFRQRISIDNGALLFAFHCNAWNIAMTIINANTIEPFTLTLLYALQCNAPDEILALMLSTADRAELRMDEKIVQLALVQHKRYTFLSLVATRTEGRVFRRALQDDVPLILELVRVYCRTQDREEKSTTARLVREFLIYYNTKQQAKRALLNREMLRKYQSELLQSRGAVDIQKYLEEWIQNLHWP